MHVLTRIHPMHARWLVVLPHPGHHSCFPDRVDKLMAVDMSVTPREFTGVDAVGCVGLPKSLRFGA